jgi:hypothetical protein
MVARHTGTLTAALAYAERGAAAAPAGLVRAQLHAWAELEADPAGQAPGRFGFDEPELALHQAETHLTLAAPTRPAPAPRPPTIRRDQMEVGRLTSNDVDREALQSVRPVVLLFDPEQARKDTR